MRLLFTCLFLCAFCCQTTAQINYAVKTEDCRDIIVDKSYSESDGIRLESSLQLKTGKAFRQDFETIVDRETKIELQLIAQNCIDLECLSTLFVKLDGKFVQKVKLDFTKTKTLGKQIVFESLHISKHTLEFVLVSKERRIVNINSFSISQSCDRQNASYLTKPLKLPESADMGQNEPNPFQETTTIPFEILEKSMVSIIAYDKNMSPLDTITHQPYEAGYHFAMWDISKTKKHVPDGLLLYSIETKDFKYLKKMFRIKPEH